MTTIMFNKMLGMLLLISAYQSGLDARQIRISRYDAQVEEDTTTTASSVLDETTTDAPEVEAIVREVTAYPAAGYRPGRAFNLPNEAEVDTTTTSLPTTTTFADAADDDDETTTEDYTTKTPYAASGLRPYPAFNLPTEEANKSKDCNKTENVELTELNAKAPYPAAGFRPCQPFTLPTEQDEAELATNAQRNPACGVHTNPLAPLPPAGSTDEPESESIPANTAKVAVAPLIWRQPLILPQPLIYLSSAI